MLGALIFPSLLISSMISAGAQEVNILALGDSLTQGYGLIEADGLVPQLRGWLADRGHDVRIINGGVSGDTTAGGLARLEWSLTPEINGLIVALGGNDLLRGIDPAQARSNLTKIMEIAEQHDLKVLLIGTPAPGNYGPEYQAQFDSIFPDLADQFNALVLPDFFAGMRSGADPGAWMEGMQPDGIHPNSEGVRRNLQQIGPMVEALIVQIKAS
jgi:acyl-CoA thioesterase-1